MRWCLSFALLLVLGCPDDPPAPPPISDGGAIDAPRPDVGRRDAFIEDAGPTGPVVDGVVEDAEWRDAVLAESEVATDREGSTLNRLRAVLHEDQLLVAVEGSLAAGDTIAIFVDRALGEPEGVADLAELADDEGELDIALSTDLSAPANFRADVALGTGAMPQVGPDDTAGWRDLAMPTELFGFAEQSLVCGASACEAALPLESLGGARPRTIALFARLLRDDGSWTNQTLPEDDAEDPATVSVVLELVDGMPPEPDAGMPDGGMPDAGPVGVVVDGTLSPGEWDGAALVDDVTLTTEGTVFEGNALRTLRVLRDASDVYVAVEGDLTSGNAILVYMDGDVGGGDGVVNTGEFDDIVGALDRAFATKLIILPAEFRVDFVWGTLDLGRAAGGIDDRMGWRDVATNPSSFRAVSTPTTCTADVCETRLPLSELGAVGTLGFFVRLGASDSDALSNQTLPMEGDPTFATVYLEVAP